MRFHHSAIPVGLMLVVVLSNPALGQEVSDLLASPDVYASREIVLTGELVGDYSQRDDVVWVQLNDDSYTHAPLVESGVSGTNTGIGIRIPVGIFDSTWGDPGGFGVQGPVVEITGVFRYQDPGRSGETFVDVTTLRLISAARPLETGSAGWPFVLGGIMVAGSISFLLVRRETAPTGRRLTQD